MPSSQDQDHIDELKKSLYSRSVPDIQTRRKLRPEDENLEVPTDWKHEPDNKPIEPVVLNTKYKDHSMSFFTKLFLFSLIFCIVVVGIGAYLFFKGANLISADNININISGPVSIAGGEPITFDIVSTNNNNIELESVDMFIEFPAGTMDPSNSSQILRNYRKFLGNIPAGGSVKDSVMAMIFGEENLQKQITVTLTYSVKGSSSVFTKVKSYDVLLRSSPVSINVSTFKEITSGQEFDMRVEITSNSKDPLRGIIFEAVYPFGYKFISSTLEPLSGNNTWNIGDIPPGGKRAFTIKGSLSGEDNDLRVFHFNIGAKSNTNPNRIGTQFVSIQRDITIQKPFIALSLEVEGDDGTDDFVGQFDRSSTITVRWFNNLSTIVSNMKIVVNLSGSAFDQTRVTPGLGYYDSRTNSITWSQQTNPELASVGPGDSGTVTFSLVPKNLSSTGNPVINPRIMMSASVSGNRTQEVNVPSQVTSTTKRNIIIGSSVDLTGRIVRSVGSIQNTGLIPPKVDQPTTYTVIWSINNTSSLIRDTEVKATLPPYVKWMNVISPSSESVTYDENSGLVTWNVGNVSANNLGSSQRKEVAFQVLFTPSVIQAGNVPTLVNQATLTAIDGFTNKKITSNQDQLTTRFSTDPTYKQGDEIVVR